MASSEMHVRLGLDLNPKTFMSNHICCLCWVSTPHLMHPVTKSVMPYHDAVCVLIALEKQVGEWHDGGSDVMDEATHGGQGGDGGKGNRMRESEERDTHLRGPLCSAG